MEERKNKEEKRAENIENQLCEEKHTNLEPQTCKIFMRYLQIMLLKIKL